jgi:hypothetical protein
MQQPNNVNFVNYYNFNKDDISPNINKIPEYIDKKTNKNNRNLDVFLNTNKTKNNLNQTNKKKNSFDKTLDKSISNNSRSRSRENTINKSNYITSNDVNSHKAKKYLIKNKQKNFGERLYNYNNYYNSKLKNKLEEEKKERIRSATPKITRKAKNLQRDKNFHERLYPFNFNCELNIFNSNKNFDNSNCDIHSSNNDNIQKTISKNQNYEYNYYSNIENETDDMTLTLFTIKTFLMWIFIKNIVNYIKNLNPLLI